MKRASLYALAVVAVTSLAQARPGGGQSFSSGSSRSGSFGGSSGRSSSWSSGGSSWSSGGSSRSSGGSSWSSGGSSYSSSGGGSTYVPPRDDAYTQGITDQSDCTIECVHKSFAASMSMTEDGGGFFDTGACESDCIARKLKERTAASASYSSTVDVAPSPSAPDPPLSRKLMPLTIVLVLAGSIAGVSYGMRRRKEREWATWAQSVDEVVPPSPEDAARYASVNEALAAVGSADKGFSRVLFEDFLYALYAEVHTARGGAKLDRLGPYLDDRARSSLAHWPADAVEGIIVGSASLRDVRADLSKRVLRVVVAFEANYTERRAGAEQSFYAREEWVLERSADARSRPPDRARVIGCANCGAPLEKIVGGACGHCGTPASGVADWRVTDVVVVERESRGPILTGTTEERGTDAPTLVAPDVKRRWEELCARDPEISWASFNARLALVFATFHRTWAAQDLADVRPFLSDMLFETQRYWVAAYKAQGLRNVTEDPTIVTTQLSKIARDPYFDAVTVRVFATCKDYTLDAHGKVVGGSRERERQYTEYWTFIRSVKKSGAPKATTGCPSCGAPVGSIGMTGDCKSCGVKVTSGEFDWILSRIEQDEVYEL